MTWQVHSGAGLGVRAEHPLVRLRVERTPAGPAFTVRAVSRPATALARAGGPVTRVVQDLVARRYLRAATG